LMGGKTTVMGSRREVWRKKKIPRKRERREGKASCMGDRERKDGRANGAERER